MSWTTNSISKLKTLWEKGISTSEIGKKLGFSKNAIVGKAHRLGLKSRSNTTIKTIKRKKIPALVVPKVAPKVEVEKIEKTQKPEIELPVFIPKKLKKNAKVIGIMDLKKGMCRWPMGDPRSPDFSFCGEPVFKNKPYCLTHCSEAYTLSGKHKDLKPDEVDIENDFAE